MTDQLTLDLNASIDATAPKERRDVNPEFDCEAFTLKPLQFGERADCESDGHYMCNYCKRFDRSSAA